MATTTLMMMEENEVWCRCNDDVLLSAESIEGRSEGTMCYRARASLILIEEALRSLRGQTIGTFTASKKSIAGVSLE